MTLPTTDHQSVQVAKLAANPPERLATDEQGGRKRVAYGFFTVPVGGVAIAETVAMCMVPKGARILGGQLASEAMSSGGAAASVQVGDGATAARFLGTTSIDAAAVAAFANTMALGFGTKLTADTWIVLTAVTEAWAAGQDIAVAVDYVAD